MASSAPVRVVVAPPTVPRPDCFQGLLNQVPTVDAGPNLKVLSAEPVEIDGSASSDPEGQAITYSWRQTAGPSVVLSGPTEASPHFFERLAADGVSR